MRINPKGLDRPVTSPARLTLALALAFVGASGSATAAEVLAHTKANAQLNAQANGSEALNQNLKALEPINVIGTDLSGTQTTAGPVIGYRALSATSATKTDTPLERIPQNIQVIPRSLIDDQGAVFISDAVRNVSNVQPLDSRVIGNVEQVSTKIRGFGAEQWLDGYPGNLFGAGDREGLANVERIEVLKGPNAILYGGGAGAPVGGVINVISKLPTPVRSYELGGTISNRGYWSPYFDLNQPVNESGTALFRLTGQYSRDDSFINVVDAKRYNINPTLLLTNKTGTSLTLQGFLSHHEQETYSGLPVFGTILGDYKLSDKFYFGDKNIKPSYTKQHGVTATLDHQFNQVWSGTVKTRWSESELDQFAQASLWDATGTGGTPTFPPSTFDVNNMEHFDKQREFSINPTIQAKFDAGQTSNVILFGADYSVTRDKGFMHADTLGNMCFLMGGGCSPALVDVRNPNFPAFTRPVVGVGEGASFFDFDVTYRTKGIYSQIQSTLYDRVHLLLGGRLGSLDVTYKEGALSPAATFETKETRFLPRAGVVVDIIPGLSAYANYAEGMKWVPFSQTFAEPKPERSRTYETGLKFDAGNVLSGTLAVFQIDRTDVPYQISFGKGALSKQRSRGFEADVIFQLHEQWKLLASYGYTDAYFATATPNVARGTRVPMVPQHSGRLWLDYTFDASVLPGWSMGAGVYAASSQTVNAQYEWRTDGYFTVDAAVRYENKNLRASLSFKNLTGEHYYTPYNWFGGQVAPGAPRTVFAQIGYKF